MQWDLPSLLGNCASERLESWWRRGPAAIRGNGGGDDASDASHGIEYRDVGGEQALAAGLERTWPARAGRRTCGDSLSENAKSWSDEKRVHAGDPEESGAGEGRVDRDRALVIRLTALRSAERHVLPRAESDVHFDMRLRSRERKSASARNPACTLQWLRTSCGGCLESVAQQR